MTLPWIIYFNPRAPCGARRTVRSPVIGANAFQSTRPMRGATNDWGTGSFDWEISIHAPHAGRDGSDTEAPASLFRFQSTRPMRGATGLFILIWASVIFQSTRPMRGATCLRHGTIITMMAFQSTRPMRGATNHWKEFNGENTISIHAPHAGRDFRAKPSCLEPLISIHAPHAGRDFAVLLRDFCSPYFNPRAPCGARLIQFPLTGLLRLSQSTRPMRGATLRLRQHGGKPIFQSTRPMRGATAMRTHGMTCGANFNPRAPCGARPRLSAAFIRHSKFQSTRPMRGATR